MNIERENGYIILDNLETVEITKEKNGHTKAMWVLSKDREYYFKELVDEKKIYNELFSSIIAKKVNIPTVTYDLAKYKDIKGVICDNYNEKHEFEISLMTIVMHFYQEYIKKHSKDYVQTFLGVNNLEIIWEALMYYFQDREDKEEIVSGLVKEIIDTFILQNLIGNADLNLTNITIINQDKPKLAKNYDYGTSGLVLPTDKHYYVMDAMAYDNKRVSAKEVIKTFLSMSDSSYYDYFKEKVMMLPDVLDIFLEVEYMTGISVPLYIENSYSKWYMNNKSLLNELVDEYKSNLKL